MSSNTQSVKKFVTVYRSIGKETPRNLAYQHYYDINKQHKNYHEIDVAFKPIESRFTSSMSNFNNMTTLSNINTMTEPRAREEYGYTSNYQKKSSESKMGSLKNELQNLKLEVNKLMTNKGGIGLSRTPKCTSEQVIYTPSSFEKTLEAKENKDRELYLDNSSDSQSLKSYNLINEPLRRLYMRTGSYNYDHSHYLQMYVYLLITELKNLKNKYNAKKTELKEKCEILYKKNYYLQVSLQKSEASLHECHMILEKELALVKKQLLKKTVEEEVHVPTKDLQDDEACGNEMIKQKMKKLYDEISDKAKKISELKSELEDIYGQNEKKTFELKKYVYRANELSKQLYFSKREQVRMQQYFEAYQNKKKELLHSLYNLKQKNSELSNELCNQQRSAKNSYNNYNQSQYYLKKLREKDNKLQVYLYYTKYNNKKLRQLVTSNEQYIEYLKNNNEEQLLKIEQLYRKVQAGYAKCVDIENYYKNFLDDCGKKYEYRFIRLHEYMQAKLQNQANNQMMVIGRDEDNHSENSYIVHELQCEMRRWKTYYKLLKTKHEEYTQSQKNRKDEMNIYYKGYMDYKQKYETIDKKHKELKYTSNNYFTLLRQKETELLNKDVYVRKMQSEMARYGAKTACEMKNLKNYLKELQEKYNEEVSKGEKESTYRKYVYAKICGLKLESENYENDLKDIIERIQKRLLEQDEKISRNVKDAKTKETLVNKLKSEIRDVMENNYKEINDRKNAYIQAIAEYFNKKQLYCYYQSKKHMSKYQNILDERAAKLIEESVNLKSVITGLEKYLIDIKQYSQNMSHMYNTKCAEIYYLTEKFNTDYYAQLQRYEELRQNKEHFEKMLTNEVNIKNYEIDLLRDDIRRNSQLNIRFEDHSFDEALKSQIELSKSLRYYLNKKNEYVYRLRDSFSLLRSQHDNMKSYVYVNKLKFLSYKKNIEVNYQIEVQNLKNKLSTYYKKLCSLYQKIKQVLDYNKKKDSFIQTYIMGKKLPTAQQEFVGEFAKQYEIAMGAKDILERLKTESLYLEKLQNYNYSLMKYMAEMKEKMLLYELIGDEKVSLYYSCDMSKKGSLIHEGSPSETQRLRVFSGHIGNSPSQSSQLGRPQMKDIEGNQYPPRLENTQILQGLLTPSPPTIVKVVKL